MVRGSTWFILPLLGVVGLVNVPQPARVAVVIARVQSPSRCLDFWIATLPIIDRAVNLCGCSVGPVTARGGFGGAARWSRSTVFSCKEFPQLKMHPEVGVGTPTHVGVPLCTFRGGAMEQCDRCARADHQITRSKAHVRMRWRLWHRPGDLRNRDWYLRRLLIGLGIASCPLS